MGTHQGRALLHLEAGNLSMLPKYIEAAISAVFREKNREYLVARLQLHSNWRQIVNRAASAYVFRDVTDFNYGFANTYQIWLTTDDRAAIFSQEVQERVLKDYSEMESMKVSISVLAPYFLISYQRVYVDSTGRIIHEFSEAPFSHAQMVLSEEIARELIDIGIAPLEQAIANRVVDDVETGLCDRGTATVADCIFGDPR